MKVTVMSVVPVMSDLLLLGPILGTKMSQCLTGSGCLKDQEIYDLTTAELISELFINCHYDCTQFAQGMSSIIDRAACEILTMSVGENNCGGRYPLLNIAILLSRSLSSLIRFSGTLRYLSLIACMYICT